MENSQMENIYNLNGGDLAFVGDAYYSLRIREYLIKKGNTKLDVLHKLESLYVSRFGQEKAVDAIMPYLKEDEEEILIIRKSQVNMLRHQGLKR